MKFMVANGDITRQETSKDIVWVDDRITYDDSGNVKRREIKQVNNLESTAK